MKKILFLIHDLGQGGAEKVLVNLVNNLDQAKYDISVTVLFGGGVNEQFLNNNIHLEKVFPRMIPANTKWSKIFSPEQLYRYCINDEYDIVVSYLEGLSARVVSGCQSKKTKIVTWIHVEQHTREKAAYAFRNFKESKLLYERFDRIICVSQEVKNVFNTVYPTIKNVDVLYNTVESEKIKSLSTNPLDISMDNNTINLCAVGSLKPSKGFDRLLNVHKRLIEEGFLVHTYILGKGPEREKLENMAKGMNIQNTVSFLGYHTNPYKYIAAADIFVCCSYQEGFSTAATEALIVGTAVCTVDVSGMREMLGDNEYGIITKNSEDDFYKGLKKLIENKKILEHYKEQAIVRGKLFSTETTVKEVEKFLDNL